jgi:hypothetical protein
MIRKILAALALMVAVLAGSLVASTPAQAVGSCPNDWICFWNTSGSTTSIWSMDSYDTSPGECHSLPSAATSYITNKGGFYWKLYTGAYCQTWPVGTLYPETSGGIGAPWNNNSRSFMRS